MHDDAETACFDSFPNNCNFYTLKKKQLLDFELFGIFLLNVKMSNIFLFVLFSFQFIHQSVF